MNRQKLKEVIRHINEARTLIAGEPVDNQNKARFVDALHVADQLALHIWEEGRIRDGVGKEPLDSKEEAMFNSLQQKFKFTDEVFAKLTHSQKFSAARVMARNIEITSAHLTDHLGLVFPHIYIGVEEDGYAHS